MEFSAQEDAKTQCRLYQHAIQVLLEQVNSHFDHRPKELPGLKTSEETEKDLKNLYTIEGTLVHSLLDIDLTTRYLVACQSYFVPVKMEHAVAICS